jgi:hypothetical protein
LKRHDTRPSSAGHFGSRCGTVGRAAHHYRSNPGQPHRRPHPPAPISRVASFTTSALAEPVERRPSINDVSSSRVRCEAGNLVAVGVLLCWVRQARWITRKGCTPPNSQGLMRKRAGRNRHAVCCRHAIVAVANSLATRNVRLFAVQRVQLFVRVRVRLNCSLALGLFFFSAASFQ